MTARIIASGAGWRRSRHAGWFVQAMVSSPLRRAGQPHAAVEDAVAKLLDQAAGHTWTRAVRRAQAANTDVAQRRDGGICLRDVNQAEVRAAHDGVKTGDTGLLGDVREDVDQPGVRAPQHDEQNADGTAYTFTLYEGILFHDGDALTAQTVKNAYARCIWLGQSISNVLTRFIPTLDQIEVLDDRTLTINLERPQPLLLAALAGAFGTWVVNPRYVQENVIEEDPWAHDFYATNMVGSGPFLLTEYSPNERIVLERFADYRDGWDADQFTEIVLCFVPEITVRQQLIEQGEIDATTHNLSPESLEALQAHPDLKVEIYDSTLASWVAMNATKLSREARIAFGYAFRYDDVVNGAYKVLIKRSGPVPTTVRGYDPDIFLYQTDLAKAKTLLTAAGINEGDAFEYVLESGNAVEDVVAQLFQANLQEIGITLEILSIDPATVSDMIYSEADPEVLPHFFGGRGWWPDCNDPYNQLYPSFVEASIGGGNASRWVSTRFEKLMSQAAAYTEEEELATIMKEAQDILTEQDPPAVYYGQQLWYTVLRKVIDGLGWNPLYLSSYHPLRSLIRATA